MIDNALKKSLRNIYYFLGQSCLDFSFVKRHRGIAAILMYHRILPKEQARNDWARTSISIEQFESHLRHIAGGYLPISIGDFSLNRKETKRFPVLLTFDDGYKDNLTNALPLLKKYNVPAVIYMTTRYPEGDCSIWWYELLDLCQKKEKIVFQWKNRVYTKFAHTPNQKFKRFHFVRDVMNLCDESEQTKILDEIREGGPPQSFESICLTWEDIKRLDAEPLITIGAHTHSHPVLSRLDENEILREFALSKALLEKNLGHGIVHFSYPYGRHEYAGEREFRIAERAGFKTAATTEAAAIRPDTNLFALPRHVINSYIDKSSMIDIKLSGWSSFWKRQI